MNITKETKIIKIVFAIVAVFLGVAFVFWTALPYWQMRMAYKGYFDAAIDDNTDFLENHSAVFSPNNPLQQKFSFQFLFRILGAYNAGYVNPNGKLYNFGIARLEESQARKDNFGYFDMSLGIAYNSKGDRSPTKELAEINYAKATDYFKKARLTLPNFPTVNVQYALNLERRGKLEEAVSLLRDQIELFPDFQNYHYYLGVLLAKEKNKTAEALSELEPALASGINLDQNATMGAYYSFLLIFSERQDKPRLVTTLDRLKIIDPAQSDLYDSVLSLVNSKKKIPKFNFDAIR